MSAGIFTERLDQTHDATLRSWVESANGHDWFPIQNLPLGVFTHRSSAPRGGAAIGEFIVDLAAVFEAGLFTGAAAQAAYITNGASLNAYLSLPAAHRGALRQQLSALLRHDSPQAARMQKLAPQLLRPAIECQMLLPAEIGGFTDFMASLHHVQRFGRLSRPDSPVHRNFRHVPVGYNGRASTVQISGTPLVRPQGQFVEPGSDQPRFAPTEQLDFETEMGLWIAGRTDIGTPVPIALAAEHIAGMSLVNDWSARDMQRWETLPLGPFLGKSFLTTVSPWLVSLDALEPFRTAQPTRPAADPAPLPYLRDDFDQARGAFDITIETLLRTPKMAAASELPERISRASLLDLYWTPAQLLAQHTSNGCNLRPGDLLATGTVSGPTEDSSGCMLELTQRGQRPLRLANGETRRWLEDGDEIIQRATCEREGFATIGFGECRGTISKSRHPR